MKLSVIIPTCDRPEALRDCLRRVMKQAGSYEVIVSDDGRSGVKPEMEGVIWVEGPRRGPAANRNCGARRATGDWLIFLDDDCLPDDEWLAAYEAGMSGDVEILEGRTICPTEDRFGFYEIVENIEGGALWSCNFAVRRDKFAELGGFDEDFLEACMEDMEFAWRARKRGLRSRFVAAALVTHAARKMGFADLLKRAARHRWALLYRLKTGQRNPDWSLPRAMAELVATEWLNNLRMVYHLRRKGERRRIKSRMADVLWRWISLPLFLPYYIYWEIRYGKMVKSPG